MILYLYIAAGQGLTTLWGQNFDVNRHLLSLQSYVASFKKSPWSLILYNKCSLAGADSPQGTKFWCQQICLLTSFICCKFKKNVFEVWFYTFFFFHDLIHVAPAQGQRDPRGLNLVSTERPYHFSHLLQVSKKSLWSLILYNCFHDLIHVYSSGAGDKILMSKERPYHFTHLLQVSKKSLWSLILNNFVHDLIHVYNPGD